MLQVADCGCKRIQGYSDLIVWQLGDLTHQSPNQALKSGTGDRLQQHLARMSLVQWHESLGLHVGVARIYHGAHSKRSASEIDPVRM